MVIYWEYITTLEAELRFHLFYQPCFPSTLLVRFPWWRWSAVQLVVSCDGDGWRWWLAKAVVEGGGGRRWWEAVVAGTVVNGCRALSVLSRVKRRRLGGGRGVYIDFSGRQDGVADTGYWRVSYYWRVFPAEFSSGFCRRSLQAWVSGAATNDVLLFLTEFSQRFPPLIAAGTGEPRVLPAILGRPNVGHPGRPSMYFFSPLLSPIIYKRSLPFHSLPFHSLPFYSLLFHSLSLPPPDLLS